MKLLLLCIGVAICFAERKAENLRLKKTNTALRQALQNLQKSPEENVGWGNRGGLCGAGKYWNGDRCVPSFYSESGDFNKEEAIARAYQWEEREMCVEECGNRDPNDYERCKNRCVEAAVSEGNVGAVASRGGRCGAGRVWNGRRCVPSFYNSEENVGAVASRGGRCGAGRVWNGRRCVPSFYNSEKAVARDISPKNKEERCIAECGFRQYDFVMCLNNCLKRGKAESAQEEKAVGGSWENGKCMSYGSYLTDAGATVNDMGTGWSESSCQSECDYSSTTKACQYEFSSQRCLMIGFYTNEIYGAGDYDAVCYVK